MGSFPGNNPKLREAYKEMEKALQPHFDNALKSMVNEVSEKHVFNAPGFYYVTYKELVEMPVDELLSKLDTAEHQLKEYRAKKPNSMTEKHTFESISGYIAVIKAIEHILNSMHGGIKAAKVLAESIKKEKRLKQEEEIRAKIEHNFAMFLSSIEVLRSYQNELKEKQLSYDRQKAEYHERKKQRLCTHCGGQKGFFGKCKACQKRRRAHMPSAQIDIPERISNHKVLLGGYKWRVLDVQVGKVLLLMDSNIGQKHFHNEQQDVTWKTCDLRNYLNGEFYNSLGETEKSMIVEKSININYNPVSGIARGLDNTIDKVFLLSTEEVVKYFGGKGNIISSRPYKAVSYYIDDEFNEARQFGTGYQSWWLRTPGIRNSYTTGTPAVYVSSDGKICLNGTGVYYENYVRPALWLSL